MAIILTETIKDIIDGWFEIELEERPFSAAGLGMRFCEFCVSICALYMSL